MQNIPLKLFTLSLGIVIFGFSSANVDAQEPLLPCEEHEKEVLETTAENEVKRIAAFTPAKALKRVDPKYPKSAAIKGAEGWVELSFVVDENGKVQDPIVEDSGGHRGFKRAAMNAVKKWKYSPAMKDGHPTEMCNQKVILDFYIGNRNGGSKKFVAQYQLANALIEKGDLTGAEEAINSLHDMQNRNRYENAWLWNIDAHYSGLIKDNKRQLSSIKRLIASSRMHDKNVFGETHMGKMNQRLLILEVLSKRYADALDTIEKIKGMPNGETLLASIPKLISHIEEVRTSNKNISVNITLQEQSTHFHTLLRKQFAFANIKGDLETVEVWCDSKREIFTVAEDHIWEIPSSWGQCRVKVSGKENTQFDLVEVSKV